MLKQRKKEIDPSFYASLPPLDGDPVSPVLEEDSPPTAAIPIPQGATLVDEGEAQFKAVVRARIVRYGYDWDPWEWKVEWRDSSGLSSISYLWTVLAEGTSPREERALERVAEVIEFMVADAQLKSETRTEVYFRRGEAT